MCGTEKSTQFREKGVVSCYVVCRSCSCEQKYTQKQATRGRGWYDLLNAGSQNTHRIILTCTVRARIVAWQSAARERRQQRAGGDVCTPKNRNAEVGFSAIPKKRLPWGYNFQMDHEMHRTNCGNAKYMRSTGWEMVKADFPKCQKTYNKTMGLTLE